MVFDNIFEKEWSNQGTTPSDELASNGFEGGMKPPAGVFNWFWCKTIKAIKELQSKLSATNDNVNILTPITGQYNGSDIVLNGNLIPLTASGKTYGYVNNHIRDLLSSLVADRPKTVYIVSSSGDYYVLLYFAQSQTKVISSIYVDSDVQVRIGNPQDSSEALSVQAYYVPLPVTEMDEATGRKLLACEQNKTYTYMIIK